VLRLILFLTFGLSSVVCCTFAQTTQAPAPQPGKTPALLDINHATAEDFANLPGIGPELAGRMVAFREKNGPFRRVEDLLVIKGMGRKKWRAIRPLIRVEDSPRGVGGP
jgi:competence ComEA-like helix-hairpin-helix protein